MAKNPTTDKTDPLHMCGTKHGVKIDKDGTITIPDDLYEKFRPEGFDKGLEKRVDTFQAKFAASVLAAASEDIVTHFKKHKDCEKIEGKGALAYRGNNMVIRVARNKSFSMGKAEDKKAFATVGITRSFKTTIKPVREHLADLAKKRKI